MQDNTTPKQKVIQDIREFKEIAPQAEIEFVGRDTEYVPDSPRLKETHPNST